MLLGGVVAVDGTSFGQLMVSRPFVAAAVAGWIVGDPVHGAAMGVVLEAFHLAVLPVGAAKYPEGGPPAVAGGAVYAASNPTAGTLLLLVLFVLLLEWVAGESVRILRQINVRLISGASGERWTAARLERRHLAAIVLDYLRGILLVTVSLLALIGVARLLVPLWAISESITAVLVTAMVAGLLAGALRGVGSRIWFAAAGAAGALLLQAV
jgi:mannose/fructose/N-acetylgalactosamine-specific phosphotransferase system component IIC